MTRKIPAIMITDDAKILHCKYSHENDCVQVLILKHNDTNDSSCQYRGILLESTVMRMIPIRNIFIAHTVMGMIPGNIIETSYAENIMMRMILNIMM